jgi:hypothetical protein
MRNGGLHQCNSSEKLTKDNQYLREIRRIHRLGQGEQIGDIWCVRFTHSSVCTIHGNNDIFTESARWRNKVSVKRTSYSRSSTMECMEKNVEYLDRGSESTTHSCKHAFG